MTVQVQIDDEEMDFEFQSAEFANADDNGRIITVENWKGSSEQRKDLFIEFSAVGDRIVSILFPSEVNLVEGDAEANQNLLIARIEEKLKGVIASRSAGIEYTGESTDIQPLTNPKPYDPDKIKVRQDKFSVEYVVNKMILGKNLIDLNPEFQRKFVWDRKRQSNLIESLMLGIPIPVFYLAEGDNGSYHVIDGLQRLSTLRDFLSNKFTLRNLEHLSDYDGCYFDKKSRKVLDTKMTTRIETAQLHFNIIEATSPPEVKYDIFTRLNTGGQPLNNQEVRNCLALPHSRKFLQRCADSQIFKQATGGSISSKRMDDQEMVLRFVGFYLQRRNEIEYLGDINPFLNDVLDIVNRKNEKELKEIEEKFIRAMENAYHLFGPYSFRKCTPDDLKPKAKRQFINKSMFVAWSISLTAFDSKQVMARTQREFLAPIVANEMITIHRTENEEVLTRPSSYFLLFTAATTDKKTIASALQYTDSIIQSHLQPKLQDAD